MAEDGNGQERTESATPRRREMARSEGNVARSGDVVSVVSLAAGLAALSGLGPRMAEGLATMLRRYLGDLATVTLRSDTISPFFIAVASATAVIVLPFAAIVGVAGLGASLAQNGVLLSAKPLAPRFSRISPAAGVKKLFSMRALVELAKSLLKIAVVGGVVGWTLLHTAPSFVPLVSAPPATSYGQMLGTMLKIAAAATAALALLALLDFFFQRWDWERQIRMTRQELKEEFKQHEGDPLLKAKMRSRQQETARRRMMSDVKTADVVVTNPTHYAVALKYDTARMSAPRVVAKGARILAARIKEIAREAGVPIVEDPPLARALYKACRVGSEIPLAFYKAVAELLAFVYRRRERVPGGIL
ncbi:MAG: flagellar biosynthesis protein FlhB [bacterium]